MKFTIWIDTFVAEKGLDLEQTLTVDGPSGANYIPLGCLVDMMKSAPANERASIKDTLVKIDFVAPGKEMHFFQHLAQTIAV